MISYSVIKKIAYVYLFIPIAIFGIGWLDTGAALVFTLFIAGALAAVWKKEQSRDVISAGKWGWIITGLIIILWVYLSGIGGFAFQNWDHPKLPLFILDHQYAKLFIEYLTLSTGNGDEQ